MQLSFLPQIIKSKHEYILDRMKKMIATICGMTKKLMNPMLWAFVENAVAPSRKPI
jgi:hypothetical protein